jgi:hypothetical protein
MSLSQILAGQKPTGESGITSIMIGVVNIDESMLNRDISSSVTEEWYRAMGYSHRFGDREQSFRKLDQTSFK